MLVLGAGASLAEALAHRPRRLKDHPPLDRTLLCNAKRFRSGPLLDEVEQQARKLGEHGLTRASPSVSFEEHLGRLFFEVNHNPHNVGTLAYFNAVDLYAREITATTNWMMGRPGLIKRMIQGELRAQRSVAVVSFNVDLLVENALSLIAHGRPSAPWSLASAYGFRDLKAPVEPAGGSGDSFEYDSAQAEIPLFKMHGSANWVFKHRDRHPPADLIGVGKPRDFYLLLRRRLPDAQIRVKTPAGGRPWYTSPLLVPPVYEKHGLIKRHLRDVWDGASKALSEATRVIFWGYSFPPADMHARHLFQGLAIENPALRAPILVNPSSDAAAALWTVLRPASVQHYRSAEAYLGRAS